jgi:hypothetical protein
MALKSMVLMVAAVLLLIPSIVAARDFDWTKDFNVRAEADPVGFKTKLTARFQIGETQIDAVLSTTKKPADAYIVLRLGEMSRQPTEYVMEKYKSNKGKGWGVLAKNLGIKPGSKEFHALKRGSDLYDDNYRSKDKGKGKGKW